MNLTKISRSFFVIVLVAVAAVMLTRQRAPVFAPISPGSTVLAFGDSVTFGTGANPGEDYPKHLAAISGWVVRNKGIPGDTAERAKMRIDAAMAEVKPALVIIEIGGNDFLRRQPEQTVKENIRFIIQRVRHAGAQAALVATPRFSLLGAAVGSLSDAALYAELAAEENVPLVPDAFAEVLSKPELKSDAIHPNAAGYRVLAEAIAISLVKQGLLAKR